MSNIPSAVSQLEDCITAKFYGKKSAEALRQCHIMGLQSPLWLWTHQEPTKSTGVAKEIIKTIHLTQWLHRNSVEMAQIAVILPASWKPIWKHEFMQRCSSAAAPVFPTVLAHHELLAMNRRDGTKYEYRAVLYILGLQPEMRLLQAAIGQEDFLSVAIGAATQAFVLCVDAGWAAPRLTAKWTQWRNVLAKFKDEQPPISGLSCLENGSATQHEGARLPSLMSASLPLCCGRHPGQRQLDYGLSPILSTCKHLCLSSFACRHANHICTERCHLHDPLHCCAYVCPTALPCGHPCLVQCGQRCNCFETIEKPLGCSHEVVLGLDATSLEPIYGTVHHIFRGVCADAALPCVVEYDTECSRCMGTMRVKCFEAVEQCHTREHKTMICRTCERVEREARARLLGELLTSAELQRRKLKSELQRTLHQQRKAAAIGLFRPGSRVEIIDSTKCVPPLFAEDDFPNVDFMDMEDPNFFSDVDGAYGIFVSNHVDVMDRNEVRNLVRLPHGKHVLVTDGGLRMIKALTSGVTSAATLLIGYHGSSSADVKDGAAGGEGDTNASDFAMAKTMVGKHYYLAQPVACADVPSGVLADKIVEVVGLDPTSAEHVKVECKLYRIVDSFSGAEEESVVPSTAEEPLKRQRVEPSVDSVSAPALRCEAQLLALPVPIAALEAMGGMEKGKHVFVTAPERQLTNLHDRLQMEVLLRHVGGADFPVDLHVSAAPVHVDIPYSMIQVVNPPESLEKRLGPCAVLHPPERRIATRKSRQMSKKSGATSSGAPTTGAANGNKARSPLVIVPFMFMVGDELAEAEGALDAAAQVEFQKRLQEVLSEKSDEMSLRNEEEAFHSQQQMPPVTAAMMAAVQQAASVPVPLPTAAEVAHWRKRAMELPAASALSTRLAHTKEKLAGKQEVAHQPEWVASMKEQMKRDDDSDRRHIAYVNSMKI